MNQNIFKIVISLLVCLILFPGVLFSREIDGHNPEYVTQQILIRFTTDTSDSRKNEIREDVGAELIKIVKSIHIELWQLPDGITTDEVIDYLNSLSEIEYLEPNYLYKPQMLPNDPYFNQLWYLKNTGQEVNGLAGLAGADISASAAWDIETGCHDIVIAVIDSGVAFDHPDLRNNVWTNISEIPGNNVDDDHNGYVDDLHGWDFVNDDNNPSDYSRDVYCNGHGTHVAGIIAAEGNNNIGVCGVMWHAQVMPLQIFDIYNQSSFIASVIQSINIISAIEYAVENGARIINCSFGGASYSQSQYDILKYANQHGVLVVCAAGNDDSNTDTDPQYPSCYDLPNIISVAATDQSGNLASYSNYGLKSVDVAAPGGSGVRGNIYSTVPPERITLFYDDFESTNDKWLTNGVYENWSVDYDFYWSNYLQDSVGDYHTDEDSKVWTKYSVNATNCRGVVIEYDLSYALENNYDFLNTEISWDDNNYFSIQEYTGLSGRWLHQTLWYNELNLGSFYLRFHLTTDYMYNYDGIMIDDVKITGIPWIFKGDEYDYKSGTSMAAPVVCGIAGLIWSLKPYLTHLEVKNCILNSVDKIPALEGIVKAGGQVNAKHALSFCLHSDFIIDFNGNGIHDTALFSPANHKWYIKDQSTPTYGTGDCIPVPGDYNGNGATDLAVIDLTRPDNRAKWYLDGIGVFIYGLQDWIPVPGDYDGDGTTDAALFDPDTGKWYIRNQGVIIYGAGAIPVPADYDGDGTTDIAVYNPDSHKWYIKDVGIFTYGMADCIPVPADYDGDGVTDLAVIDTSRPDGMAKWYIRDLAVFIYGAVADTIPVPGDYDGDGDADPCLFYQDSGKWYCRQVGVWTYGNGDMIPLASNLATRYAMAGEDDKVW